MFPPSCKIVMWHMELEVNINCHLIFNLICINYLKDGVILTTNVQQQERNRTKQNGIGF